MTTAPTKTIPDVFGLIWCIGGTLCSLYLAHRVKVRRRTAYFAVLSVGALYYLLQEKTLPWIWHNGYGSYVRDWLESFIAIWWLWAIIAAPVTFLFNRKDSINSGRRQFLQTTGAFCAGLPAVALGAGVIKRKDFILNEVTIPFPNLPKDLDGLRLVQISDMHVGAFFSTKDLRRVVDACNELRADLAIVTGDLITTAHDPLDPCIAELARLRSSTGIWGCLGNHEFYSGLEDYTKRAAARYGIEFLREEARSLRFGSSRLNLVGVDFRPWQELSEADGLLEPDQFNLLLAHTPEIFRYAAKKGFDLTLSGHTHGGQINLDVLGTNFNMVDLHTPYTKGLYRLPHSTIYVNSGLGTIGLPVRIGAPPEITLVRLCNS